MSLTFSVPGLHRLLSGLSVLAAIALAGVIRAEDYAVSSFAGVGSSAGSSDGKPGLFNGPYGVALDAARNLYVTDTVNNLVRKVNPAGQVSTLAGLAGASGTTNGTGSAARFDFPIGVAVDAAGNVFVSDSRSFTLRRITPAGVVSTFAGSPYLLGSADGAGSAARFFLPYGLAIDGAGNLYVADGGNHLIRKVTPEGVVSTLAGAANQAGAVNGTGSAARFNNPFGLAVDSAGNVYVADSGNHLIRKVTAAGVVTTLAGAAGFAGSVDGVGVSARFDQPRGVAVNASGTVFVADYGNALLRSISPSGSVTTLAGSAGVVGSTDSVGSAARFYLPTGVAAEGNTVYVTDTANNLIRRAVPLSQAGLPTISLQPLDQEVSVGQSITFRVSVAGSGVGYQWLRNGQPIAGATSATYTIASAQLSDVASFSVRVSGGGGSIDSSAGNLSVYPLLAGPIIITARPVSLHVETGSPASFSVTASGSGLTYQWLKNGTNVPGATASTYAIASAQANDVGTYTVRIASGAASELVAAKLNVGAAAAGVSISSQPQSITVNPGQAATFTVVAFGSGLSYQWLKNGSPIAGATSSTYSIAGAQATDGANYSVRVAGAGSSVESSAATLTVVVPPPPGGTSRLVNLSILTELAAAGDTFTMGYVIGGAGTSGSKPILIRAVGPTLGAAPFSIPGTLADPKLELFAGASRTGENDNWGGAAALSAAFSSVGAFAYSAAGSLDAAVLANLSAGDNSVKVSGDANGTGIVLAELYDSTPTAGMTAATPRLVNVSVLKSLGTGLTAGFVIDGQGSKRVLVRAVGPTIGAAPFNVPGAVDDPQLTLYSGAGAVLQSNDNWGGSPELTAAFAQVGAFALPANSKDAAVLATLSPGAYTVQAKGVGGTTGVAIVEVYEVP
jgi:hypothetical protein